jgi:hypothetical protein
MAVYVDKWEAPFGRMVMSHMMADTTDELNEMADKIGLPRKWIQKPGTRWEHYDVCRSKRELAIRFGAQAVSAKDLARLSISKGVANGTPA